MRPELDTEDWASVFDYASRPILAADPGPRRTHFREPFGRADVADIVALASGEPGGHDWVGAFRLRDGRFASVRAGCTLDGWDYIAGGSAYIAKSLSDIIRWGLTPGERARLNLHLPGDPRPESGEGQANG